MTTSDSDYAAFRGNGCEAHAELSEVSRALAPGPGVLVVDDEECVRKVLDAGLRQEGFAVWLAADGGVALDLYRRHRQSIDVVLLDVRMPRLDGRHTLAALQRLNPQIRCCFMSGDLGNETEERLLKLGAVVVLSKPFQMAEIAPLLRDLASKVDLSPPSVLNASLVGVLRAGEPRREKRNTTQTSLTEWKRTWHCT
jgi:CheY-like chemotaxis protein